MKRKKAKSSLWTRKRKKMKMDGTKTTTEPGGGGGGNPKEDSRRGEIMLVSGNTMMKPYDAAAELPIPSVVGGETKRKKVSGSYSSYWTRSKKKNMELLPLDVWEDILSRLPFKQALLCRCICRAWNALLARIHHHHHPNPTTAATTPATLLYYYKIHYSWISRTIVHDSIRTDHLTLAELRNGASYYSTVTRINDPYTFLGGAVDNILRPVASCHGLVCFVRSRNGYQNILVGNPLLKEEFLVVRPSKSMTNLSWWREVVGFGFSPKADRYKIVELIEPSDHIYHQPHFLICTVGDRSRGKRKACSPSWRRLLNPFALSFPLARGSYLKGGVHWLVLGSHNSVFISRLDLDTEQFGRAEAPQSPDFNNTPFEDLSLGVSDGHLIICANLAGQDIMDIWVMNEFNFWTKKLVIRSPIPSGLQSRVELLNYGKVEAAAREGAVAKVMLLRDGTFLYACTTQGRRRLDPPSHLNRAIVHIPSFLSIKDAVKI